jgi:hypothetical protein
LIDKKRRAVKPSREPLLVLRAESGQLGFTTEEEVNGYLMVAILYGLLCLSNGGARDGSGTSGGRETRHTENSLRATTFLL